MKKKLEELITKEMSKSSVQIEEKYNSIDPINITNQENDKPIEGKTYSDVAVQKIEIPSDDFAINSSSLVPEVNQEIATHVIRESQNIRTPYQHLNHKRRLFNQSTYQYHSEHK